MVMTPDKEEVKTKLKEPQLTSLHESVWWEEDDPRWKIANGSRLLPKKNVYYQPVNLAIDSYIFVFTGWRGGGKTTTMTTKGLQAQYMFNMRLIANYPIEYRLNMVNGSSKIIKAEPLDLYRLLCFDADYKNCLILLDESPDIISHMAATTWKNRLMNVWIRQLRKNRNSLMCSAQQFELLDKSFRWQTDIIVHCEDASRKYGDPSLARGEVVELEVLDNSGMWTGHTYMEEEAYNRSHGNYKSVADTDVIYPRILWGDGEHQPVFDTYHQLDIWESLRKVDMNIGKYSIGDPKIEDASKEAYETAAEKVADILNSGKPFYNQKDFFREMGEDLTVKDKNKIGSMLADAGVIVKQTTGGKRFYDFSNFDIKKFI